MNTHHLPTTNLAIAVYLCVGHIPTLACVQCVRVRARMIEYSTQAGHREFWPFVDLCGTENKNGQVVEEPTIGNHFHGIEKHLFTVMRAAAEYLNEIAETPGAESIDFFDEYMEKAERNIDLAWLVHFLYDYAFLYAAR